MNIDIHSCAEARSTLEPPRSSYLQSSVLTSRASPKYAITSPSLPIFGNKCPIFIRPNCRSGHDTRSHTLFLSNKTGRNFLQPRVQRFIENVPAMKRFGLESNLNLPTLWEPAGPPPATSGSENFLGFFRRCVSGCHTLCAMVSADFGIVPDWAGPFRKGNLYGRSFGTGC